MKENNKILEDELKEINDKLDSIEYFNLKKFVKPFLGLNSLALILTITLACISNTVILIALAIYSAYFTLASGIVLTIFLTEFSKMNKKNKELSKELISKKEEILKKYKENSLKNKQKEYEEEKNFCESITTNNYDSLRSSRMINEILNSNESEKNNKYKIKTKGNNNVRF